MDFVVKPLYLQRDDETVKKLYLIYDSNNPAYDRFAGRTRLRPNYALLGQGNIIQELRKHFDGKGIDKDTWRVTPPVFAHENLEQNHLGSADILKEDLCAG